MVNIWVYFKTNIASATSLYKTLKESLPFTAKAVTEGGSKFGREDLKFSKTEERQTGQVGVL